MFGEHISNRFWYVNDKERERISNFSVDHYHKEKREYSNLEPATYHIEIKPNSVSYSVIVVCDICAENKKLRKKKTWIEDVTDYDSW